MKKSKSVAERLQNIKLQTHLETIPKVGLEEYPKLRKPKPATLQRIQANKKNVHISMLAKPVDSTDDDKNVEVPLRQEFLSKKDQLERATKNFLNICEHGKNHDILDDDIFVRDSIKAQTISDTELDFQLKRTSSDSITKSNLRSLSDGEQQLVNVIYTKVKAHNNGFFAENIPDWYKKTFHKDIILDWIELLQASDKFDIEEVQNKIVLYAKEVKYLMPSTINELGSNKTSKLKVYDTETESSVHFVRYKHLQKSLQEYNKDASRDSSNVINIKKP